MRKLWKILVKGFRKDINTDQPFHNDAITDPDTLKLIEANRVIMERLETSARNLTEIDKAVNKINRIVKMWQDYNDRKRNHGL